MRQGIANWRTGSLNNRKEHNYMVSVTVPDKTISLRDMITRYQSGGKVKSFTPVYLDEANVIPVGFERMDLTERAQFARDLPHFIADSRGRLQTLRQAREAAEKVAHAEAKRKEYEELRKQFETEQPFNEGQSM